MIGSSAIYKATTWPWDTMGYHGMRGGYREDDQRATDWQYSGNLWHELLGYVEVGVEDGWSSQMLTLKIGTRWGPVLFVALSPIICGFTTINHTLAILNTFWGWIWIENPSWGRIGPKSILRMVFRLVVFLGYPWEPAYPKFSTHFYPDGLDLKPSVADFSHMHIDATSVVKINH